MLLEICVNDVESAIKAEKAGADRIELCSNLSEGGITPSLAYVEFAMNHLSIPVFPIIRPRSGDFLYTDAEFEIMLNDVKQFAAKGCKGIVLGILKSNGEIDVQRTTKLVLAASTMEVTFHRAFDRTNNSVKALQDVIETGCKRILTSGLYKTAYEGRIVLKQLVKDAANKIIIMPGSGVRSANIKELMQVIPTTEFHSSASTKIGSIMLFKNTHFEKEDFEIKTVDENEIRLMKKILNTSI
jgi:copper homeostasis protein